MMSTGLALVFFIVAPRMHATSGILLHFPDK